MCPRGHTDVMVGRLVMAWRSWCEWLAARGTGLSEDGDRSVTPSSKQDGRMTPRRAAPRSGKTGPSVGQGVPVRVACAGPAEGSPLCRDRGGPSPLAKEDRAGREATVGCVAGGQGTLQPPTSRSDERFTDKMTVYAAFIAHNRLGNERAVNVCKRSVMVKRRLVPNMNPARLNYVWRGWAIRANFMYKSIL